LYLFLCLIILFSDDALVFPLLNPDPLFLTLVVRHSSCRSPLQISVSFFFVRLIICLASSSPLFWFLKNCYFPGLFVHPLFDPLFFAFWDFKPLPRPQPLPPCWRLFSLYFLFPPKSALPYFFFDVPAAGLLDFSTKPPCPRSER